MIAGDLAVSLSALDVWDAAARDALPAHVKAWLGLMMLSNLAALAFVKNHVAARWVVGGFFVSHFLVVAGYWSTGTPILAGQVSLFHVVFWTPGALMLLRRRREMQWPSAYAVWASIALCLYAGSMFFDLKDAATFLQHLAHP